MENNISNNQQNVETKEQLIEKLNGLYDKVSELRGQLNRGINYEDTPSVIGDTGRLTDNQDAYDAAVDAYDDREVDELIDYYEDEIHEIEKKLGMDTDDESNEVVNEILDSERSRFHF